mmetsp:Transcript_8305/g.7881  ORF Transcript_8305/g.7881 Transcript_8305/m.7881 type:complete len:106 (-) Transcript_8305:588-905(-)
MEPKNDPADSESHQEDAHESREDENGTPHDREESQEKQEDYMEELKQAHDLEAKRLMDAKAQRKQVEKDAELLKNRIALLQMEEKKARKKIDETKKRTNEVTILK